MKTREINNTGAPLVKPDGTLLAGTLVIFILINAAGRRTDTFDAVTHERVTGLVEVRTDSKGEFSVNLWPNSRGEEATTYCVTVSGCESFATALVDGDTALSWFDFRYAGQTVTPAQMDVIQQYLDSMAVSTATATEQAGIATSKAELTTTKAAEAANSAAQAAAVEDNLKAYADGKDTEALVSANGYTDTAKADVVLAAQGKADTAETNAKAYADTQDDVTLTAAKSYTDTKVADMVNSAPATLDTLNELATALGDDPSFATTTANLIGQKESIINVDAKDAAILASAKSYTDTKKTETITTAAADATAKDNQVRTDMQALITALETKVSTPSFSTETAILSALTNLPSTVIEGKLEDRIYGKTLVNLLSLQGKDASAAVTVTSTKYYVIINDAGQPVTVNGTAQTCPYKFTGQTSLILSWASGKTALYEITSAEYSGTVDWHYNYYVDSATSCVSARVKSIGKNLIPGFSDKRWIIHANAVVNSDSSLTLNATATNQYNEFIFPVLPNSAYTFSSILTYTGTVTINLNELGADKVGIKDNVWSSTTLTSAIKTITTTATTKYIRLRLYSTTSGTFTFSNPMLTLSTADQTYAPYQETIQYLPTMRSIGTYKDEIYEGKHIKRISDTVILDGSLAWSISTLGVNCRRVYISVFNDDPKRQTTIIITKYNGISLMSNASIISDTFTYGTSLNITLDNADTGWLDTITPTTAEGKAYFYGWKMCASDGTTYISGTKYWKSIVDGSGVTSTCPTTLAPGFTPYKMIYALANPVITDIIEPEMIAEPFGSILVEPAFERVLTNVSGTVTLPYKVDHLESVKKSVDVGGIEEKVNVAYTLSADKLSFTTTDAATEFVVVGILDYQSTLPDLNYSYPLNVAGAIAGTNEQMVELNTIIRALALKVMGV